ncbi:MAG: hypothetical protein ACI808_002367 [Paraglaciecola sp.]|jgi:hypothetical protein
MNRRRFIISTIAVGGAAAAGAGLWLRQLKNKKDLSVATLLQTLEALSSQNIRFSGEWNAFQTFSHLAQSIEYSMIGYPQHKSDIFKSIVGKGAFSLFAKQGSMSHALSEPILGAPPINPEGFTQQALTRLVDAVKAFNSFSGELQPHFAYGELNHIEYAGAHVMHVYNHFEELVLG